MERTGGHEPQFSAREKRRARVPRIIFDGLHTRSTGMAVSVDDTPCHGRVWNLINCRAVSFSRSGKSVEYIRRVMSHNSIRSIGLAVHFYRSTYRNRKRWEFSTHTCSLVDFFLRVTRTISSRKLVGRTWLTAILCVYTRFISLSCANERILRRREWNRATLAMKLTLNNVKENKIIFGKSL